MLMKKLSFLLVLVLLCGCKCEKTVDLSSINNFNYDNVKEFDYNIHSQEYLLVRMSDLNVLYSKNADTIIYPASLTKLMTLDAVLHLENDLDNTSSISYEQVLDLIYEDASLAKIEVDKEYTLRDLLYALILPSGADAAVALENYFSNKGLDLLDEMNRLLIELDCYDTHFENTTGLHDNNHYTTLNDLFKIVMDVLKYDEGRKLLESMCYSTGDNLIMNSSLRLIRDDNAIVLGGKTGFTTESGQSVMVLFKKNNRSYVLFVANAMGNPYIDQYWHFDDAMEIIDKLY